MIEVIIVSIFVLMYILIATKSITKMGEAPVALFGAAILWAIIAISFNSGNVSLVDSLGNIFSNSTSTAESHGGLEGILGHHLYKTAEILIFLIGAMTIVEIIDLHKGFEIIKSKVTTNSKKKLLWIVGVLAFILSAIIDNLTATIVLVTLLRKIVPTKQDRLWYAGMIVIAANAGGAWSPIGDVTTTMLWIADNVTPLGLIKYVVLPSILCFLLPFGIASRLPAFQGEIYVGGKPKIDTEKLLSSALILILGIVGIVSVPVFKTVTHLPPYLGMMLALGLVWIVSEFVHPEEDFTEERKKMYSVHKALSRIEIESILFFLGILMAVGAVESLVYGSINGESVGTLRYLAEVMQEVIPDQNIVIMILGVLSALIDNVPLVAASMGMYDWPTDSLFWQFIAYSAGTGGSMIIIGSAAGVAAMGMEKIDFGWYLKNISWLALLGFLAGSLPFLFFY